MPPLATPRRANAKPKLAPLRIGCTQIACVPMKRLNTRDAAVLGADIAATIRQGFVRREEGDAVREPESNQRKQSEDLMPLARVSETRNLSISGFPCPEEVAKHNYCLSSRTPRHELQRRFDDDLRVQHGCSAHMLGIGDLLRNSDLRTQLASLPLGEYFDDRGAPRFRRLGLSFVARQNQSVRDAFGNWVDDPGIANGVNKRQNAKAYFLATEAIEKDAEYRARQHGQLLESVDVREKHRVADVQRRQLEVLFSEVPHFEQHLPRGIREDVLLPLEVGKDEERANRNHNDKTCGYLTDRLWRMGAEVGWMLDRGEVLYTSLVCSLWMKASHGHSWSQYLSMDRPTFCRMVLDFGLVDQHKVPYFWAVSLFDEAARSVRCSGRDSDTALAHLSPIVPIVSRWALTGVLDTIVRMHFTKPDKHRFIASLLPIARLRLPASIVEESGLQEHMLQQYIQNPSMIIAGGPNGEGGPEGFGLKAAAMSDDSVKDKEFLPSRREQEKCDDSTEREMKRQQAARDFFTQAMLVEPEVLNLLMQHHALFCKLHACYATDGHLSYAGLLQLCIDFSLTPAIASANFVKQVYETTRCVERAEPESNRFPGLNEMASPRDAKKEATSAKEFSPFSPTGFLKQAIVRSGEAISKMAETTKTDATRPVAKRRGSLMANLKPGEPNDRSRSKTPESSKLFAMRALSPRPKSRNVNTDETKNDLAMDWPPDLPWRGVAELTLMAERLPKNLCVSIQGLKGTIPAGVADMWEKYKDEYYIAVTFGCRKINLGTLQTETTTRNTNIKWNFEGKHPDYKPGKPVNFNLHIKGVFEPLATGFVQADSFKGADGFSGDLLLETTHGRLPVLQLTNVRVKLTPGDAQLLMRGKARSLYGVGALMDALCRISFSYLGAYGNIQQQNSSGLARAVWMLTYLRSNYAHLRQSAERHRHEGGMHEPLQKALSHPLEELWATPPMPEDIGQLPPPTMRPGLPQDPYGDIKRKKIDPRKKVPGIGAEPGEVSSSFATAVFVSRARRRLDRSSQQCSFEAHTTGSKIMRRGSGTLENLGPGATFATEANSKSEAEAGTMTATMTATDSIGSVSGRRISELTSEGDKDDDSNLTSKTAQETVKAVTGTGRRRRSRGNEKIKAQQTETAATTGPDSMKNQPPCVNDGFCQLCGYTVSQITWGNPTCRGCSVVDVRCFRTHPLRGLLLDWHPSIKPAPAHALMPTKLERAMLTPPPMSRNDKLRE